ncbi:uncharacterized protein LOC142005085 [Carettochelys insculpta]|uniref:uncharacterized protein LOC142005085 n=1 Tax=Carettochelys insculpta TaxID=44489 RepID=UPI003EBA7F47
MGQEATSYVRTCKMCQSVRKPRDRIKAPLQPLPIIEVPFQWVAVDIMDPFQKKTPRGKQFILTLVDFATRWLEAVALGSMTARNMAQALTDIFASVGWPSEILTDSGTNSLAGAMKHLSEAFNQLKMALMSEPVLRTPDYDMPFVITTDASEWGVGAILMQEGPDQQLHPLLFLSKKLSETESHWSISEKESYAIVYALVKLRPYVLGQRFHLPIDHSVLQWLPSVKRTSKKLLRWSSALQDFDLDVQHISGVANEAADSLSRKEFLDSITKDILSICVGTPRTWKHFVISHVVAKNVKRACTCFLCLLSDHQAEITASVARGCPALCVIWRGV